MNRRDFIKTGGVAAVATLVSAPSWAATPAGTAPLRIAQLGTAHSHGPGKWATLKKFPEIFSPLGIWEPNAEHRSEAGSHPEYAGARWLEEKELAELHLDAVTVEPELPDLLAYGRRALEAGWHVHLDKPPGTDLAAFVAMQKMAAEKRRVFQTGYMFRYHPAFRFCMDAARNGWLGRVFAVHGDIGSEMTADRRPWLAEAYGGSMMLLGSHLVDIAVAIMGPPTDVVVKRHRSFPQRDKYYDNEVAILDYPDGSAVIRCLNAEVGGGKRRQLLVFGENGTIELLPLEPARVRLTLKKAAGGHPAGAAEVKLPEVTGRYDEMMLDFARMTRGEPSVIPQFTADFERESHRVVLRCASRA